MADISVIIPCRNEEATIQQLLLSLFNQTLNHETFEVVIADGLSTDNTLLKISEFQKQHPSMNITVAENKKQNIPAGLNTAIRQAQGEFVIRLDAHSIPAENYIKECVQLLKSNTAENVGGIWNIMPSSDRPIAKAIALAAAHPLGMGGANYRDKNAKSGYVDTVPFGAFRRNIFDKVGLFDETLLSNEDYELNARIRKSGGRIYLNPAIQCVYFARKNLKQLAKQYWRYGFWKLQMLKRYPETIRLRQGLPPLFIASIIILLLLSLINPVFLILLITALTVYLLILFLGTFSAIRSVKGSVSLWFLTVLSIITMHFSWGTAFLFSIFKSTQSEP